MIQNVETVANELRGVLKWVRLLHDAPCVIVGGAVRDLLLGGEPRDWDVFYLETTPDDLRAEIGSGWDQPKPFKRHKALVAEFNSPFGLVQIMATPLKSVAELVAKSDWNVSAFGFDGKTITQGTRLRDVMPGRVMKTLVVSNPLFTLARGFSLADRLEMRIDRADLKALCEQVVAHIDKQDFRRIEGA